jgi:hypothetical protein
MRNRDEGGNTVADQDQFDRLLEAMPRIAEAINLFGSAEVQRSAFDALIASMGVSRPRQVAPVLGESDEDTPVAESDKGARVDEEEPDPRGAASTGSRRRRGRTVGKRSWEPIRDIDFRPEGKQAFKDLVGEKEPVTQDQKNLLAVYWLERVAGSQEIGVGHVMAAYKECDWREPAKPANSLQVTASREHWIDTKNMKSILTTPSGRNMVNHDMPVAQKSKK